MCLPSVELGRVKVSRNVVIMLRGFYNILGDHPLLSRKDFGSSVYHSTKHTLECIRVEENTRQANCFLSRSFIRQSVEARTRTSL